MAMRFIERFIIYLNIALTIGAVNRETVQQKADQIAIFSSASIGQAIVPGTMSFFDGVQCRPSPIHLQGARQLLQGILIHMPSRSRALASWIF